MGWLVQTERDGSIGGSAVARGKGQRKLQLWYCRLCCLCQHSMSQTSTAIRITSMEDAVWHRSSSSFSSSAYFTCSPVAGTKRCCGLMDLKHSKMSGSVPCFAHVRGSTPPPPQLAVRHKANLLADEDDVHGIPLGAQTPPGHSNVVFDTSIFEMDVWKTLGQKPPLKDSQQPLGPHSALFEDKDAVIVDERDRTPRNKPDWLRDFPPPPQPHWHVQPTEASAPAGSSGEGPLSIGSVGHPENCAIACRYRRRKGGCRLGTSCPQCHLCFWQRSLVNGAQRTKQQIEQQEETHEQLDSQPSEIGRASCRERV